ncbi:MAG: ComF family protein [Bacteroidota bacterium]
MNSKNLLNIIRQPLDDLLYLFFPETCAACGSSLVNQEKVMCTVCRFKVPKTNYHQWKDNPMEKHFWGRVNFERAISYLYFGKETKVQELLHQLKYKGREDVGVFMGELYGSELKAEHAIDYIDYIIPVPLHPSRERFRGFNQAYMFGKGISDATGIPIRKDFLLRETASTTQTRKSRFERWKNVEDIFVAEHKYEWEGKHLLIVDDVMTTGSTLEACSRALLDTTEVKLSAATIAVAI